MMIGPEKALQVLDLANNGASLREIEKITHICRESARSILHDPQKYLQRGQKRNDLKSDYGLCPKCRKSGFINVQRRLCIACAAKEAQSSFAGIESPIIKLELEKEEQKRYEEVRLCLPFPLNSSLEDTFC